MLLGGFLILPATFDNDPLLRVSKTALGIFGIALLVAGLSLTVLLAFAIRNALFRAENVFFPALVSCGIGLLTILYNFLISGRYVWNTPALLLTIAASVTSVIYGCLLIWSNRKVRSARNRNASRTATSMQLPLEGSVNVNGDRTNQWQDNSYYENYVRNMYPTSSHQPQPMGYDPNAITEEEMQRQQMLMLLLHKDHAPSPEPTSSTFHIDWQNREEEADMGAQHGFYAPRQSMNTPSTAYTPRPGMNRQWTNEMQPWDGVWRGVQHGRNDSGEQSTLRSTSLEQREQRRREIEAGR